jgi:hypothetical protein
LVCASVRDALLNEVENIEDGAMRNKKEKE